MSHGSRFTTEILQAPLRSDTEGRLYLEYRSLKFTFPGQGDIGWLADFPSYPGGPDFFWHSGPAIPRRA